MLSSIGQGVEAVKRGVRFAWTDSRTNVLVAICAGWFLSIGVRMIYPVMLPQLRAAYGLDLGMAGFLLTVLWGAYAIGQLPGGLFTDRFGERVTLTASTAISALMLTLVITAGHAVVLFVTSALFGLATALFGVGRFTAVSKVFPDRDGTAIGVTLAAGNFGNVVLPATAGVIAATLSWQAGFGFTVPLFVIVTVGLWLVVPRGATGGSSGDTFSSETLSDVLAALRRPAVVLTTTILILSFSAFQAFTGFYPTYLIEVKGLSPTIAAGLFSFYFALGILIQPLSGAAYDRFGIRRTLPALLLVAVTGLVLLPLVNGTVTLVGVTFLLGFMMSTIATTMPYLTDVLPEGVQGTGLGVLRTVYMLFGALSPTVFGTVADRGFFDEGFFVLAVLIGMVILLVTRLPATPSR